MSGASVPVAGEVTTILVHGGAGHVDPARLPRLRAGVEAAARAGDAVLAAGGAAVDAVVAAVRVLEDDPEFNAGTGAVLTRDGAVETDAAVMDGATRRIGAVAAAPGLGTPIAVARHLLDAGGPVLLVGEAALRFAALHGVAPARGDALITPRARARWQAEVARRAPADRDGGTVGAVARDRAGRLAAATSTGGTSFKWSGRVGDSPIPGAGTWADRAAAVSATGDGEAILRVALARGVAAAIAAGVAPDDALAAGLAELATITGGEAGLIAIDGGGRWAARRLSPTMPIAWCARRGDHVEADSAG